MKDLFLLVDAICNAYDNPAFRKADGKTFCNYAVNYVAKMMDYNGFNTKPWPLMANAMVEKMRKDTKAWIPISMGFAQSYANHGSLVIAGLQSKPHGHVVVIRPGLDQFSGKWQKNVPKCLNIGADHCISQGVNYAFKGEPEFFVWIGSL